MTARKGDVDGYAQTRQLQGLAATVAGLAAVACLAFAYFGLVAIAAYPVAGASLLTAGVLFGVVSVVSLRQAVAMLHAARNAAAWLPGRTDGADDLEAR